MALDANSIRDLLIKRGMPKQDFKEDVLILDKGNYSEKISELERDKVLLNDSEARFSHCAMIVLAMRLIVGDMSAFLSMLSLHYCKNTDDGETYRLDGNHFAHLMVWLRNIGVLKAWFLASPNGKIKIRKITHKPRNTHGITMLWKSFDRNKPRTPKQLFSILLNAGSAYEGLRDFGASFKKDSEILHKTLVGVLAYEHSLTAENDDLIPGKSKCSDDIIEGVQKNFKNIRSLLHHKFVGRVKQVLAGGKHEMTKKKMVVAAVSRILHENQDGSENGTKAVRVCGQFISGVTNNPKIDLLYRQAMIRCRGSREENAKFFLHCYNALNKLVKA